MVSCILAFFRKVPIIDALIPFICWLQMQKAWHRAAHNPMEKNEGKRQAGATAVTNQINGSLTACSIVLAAIGAVLAIGYSNGLTKAALNHLTWAAIEAIISIGIGIYTLGYISSVIHKMDVTKKSSAQIACFLQLLFIFVSALRFLFGLLYLSGAFPLF